MTRDSLIIMMMIMLWWWWWCQRGGDGIKQPLTRWAHLPSCSFSSAAQSSSSPSSLLWVPYNHHHLYYINWLIFEDSEWATAAVKMTNRSKEHKRCANEDPRPKFVKTHLTFLPFSQTAAAVIWEFSPNIVAGFLRPCFAIEAFQPW